MDEQNMDGQNLPQQPSQPPIQSTPTPEPSSNKGLIIGLIIAIIVAIGAVVYIFIDDNQVNNQQVGNNQVQQNQIADSQSETANWQTYRNEEFGFEVKYPFDWEVTNSAGKGNPIIGGIYFGPKGGNGLSATGPAGQNTVVDMSNWGIQIFNKSNVTNNNGYKFESGDKVYVIFNEGLKPGLFDQINL